MVNCTQAKTMEQQFNDECTSCKLIIIGAGIAGIGAGNCLINEGFDDFVILEASNRTGGRIWSIDLETPIQHKVELGANWIHGIDLNPIFKIARDNNLLSLQYAGRKLGQKMIFLTETGDPVNTRIVQDVDLAYGQLLAECEDFYKLGIPTPMEGDSVGGFVEREYEHKIERYNREEQRIRRRIFKHRLLNECVISGAHSMHDVALSDVGCFEELPGAHYVIPPGFEMVIDILKRDIPKQSILLEHQVTRVTWNQRSAASAENSRSICVECANGRKFRAEACLVTVSLGYLKEHAESMFLPPLPDMKTDILNRLPMGTVNKVILEFDGQVLPDGVFRIEMVWDRENMENEDMSVSWVKKIAALEAVDDRILMGWLSGREAEFMETLTDEEVGRDCVNALRAFLCKSIKPFPTLKKVTRSSWKSNPYTLGSYCHIGIGSTAEDTRNLGEPVLNDSGKPVLLFAGEATHETFYSSSHGALKSGEREAKRIVKMFSH